MIDSILLSIFTFIFFLIAIYYFEKVDFAFLKNGKEIQLSTVTLSLIFFSVIAFFGFATWFIISKGNKNILQTFYILLYTIGFLLTLFLFSPKSKLWIFLTIIFTGIFLATILNYHVQFLQDIFMASSILWVGAAVFKKLDLKIRYFLVFLIIFMFIDIYNIYLYKPDSTFSDEALLLNGLILFGNYLLGIGDFFLSYLAINAVQKDISKNAAIILSLIIAFSRFFIRLILPQFHGEIPYSIIIAPATLIIYMLYNPLVLQNIIYESPM
jgi:hypothetical protein